MRNTRTFCRPGEIGMQYVTCGRPLKSQPLRGGPPLVPQRWGPDRSWKKYHTHTKGGGRDENEKKDGNEHEGRYGGEESRKEDGGDRRV